MKHVVQSLPSLHAQGYSIVEYSPAQIKVAVTGYGKSDKTAVMALVPKLAIFKNNVTQDDEMDAIAVALTHSCHARYPQK